jgi:Tfp pilus assembly PilM family ATPase
MANRVGIELLPHVCRIVEIRDQGRGFGRKPAQMGPTRVRTFREIPYTSASPGKLTADLRRLLKGRRGLARRARVAIWGLRATHQGLLLPPADVVDLLPLARRESKAAAGNQPVSVPVSAVVSDGLVVGEIREGGRREVGYASAPPDDVRGRLQPLVDAGFDVEGVVTPAVAHSMLVKRRWASSPDQVTAVLCANTRSTALTVLRGAVVLFARELPWGPESDRAGGSHETAAVATRLASELKRSFVYVKQGRQVDVSHVLVCGDLPDLRLLTGPLMHELNVEVETLDGLEGLDVAALPEPADVFRQTVPAWRAVIAMTVEPALPLDLQPRAPGVSVKVSKSVQRQLTVAAIAACVVVGAAWGGLRYAQDGLRTKMQAVRQQIGTFEAEAQRQAQAMKAAGEQSVRIAALDALASQNTRLSLVLDAFKRAPYDLSLSSLELTNSPSGTWPLKVSGQAKSPTTADAQASFSTYLRFASGSKFVGLPIRSPEIAIRIEEAPPVTGNQGGGAASQAAAGARDIPLNQIPWLERPRDVEVLKAESIPAKDAQGRIVGWVKKFTIGLPSWWKNRGWAPPEVVQAIEDHNRRWRGVTEVDVYGNPTRGNRGGAGPARASEAVQPEPPPEPAFVGTILDFVVRFEVKK